MIKKITKKTWFIISGLFLLPFGIIISLLYLLTHLIIFKKPNNKSHTHKVLRESTKRLKKGVI